MKIDDEKQNGWWSKRRRGRERKGLLPLLVTLLSANEVLVRYSTTARGTFCSAIIMIWPLAFRIILFHCTLLYHATSL